MKQIMMVLFTVFLCVIAPAVRAQGGSDAVHVPLQDPSRPARVHAQLLNGSITVRGADIRDVVVESRGSGSEHERRRHERSDPPEAQGMKRLDNGNTGLEVKQENNQVTIKTSAWLGSEFLVITVPRRTSLQLKALNGGGINVEGVEGEIDANDLNGSISLHDVAGSVLIHSLNGSVKASLNRVDPAKPMFFSTLSGDIDVTLPPDVRANVRMKTDNGEIYSDFDVKLNASGKAMTDDSGKQADGSYHVRFDHTLRGTINGGGPEYQFTSFNGRIFIRRRK